MAAQRLDPDPSSVIDNSSIIEADPLPAVDRCADEVGRRLVNATIDCIDQLGYASVSTAEVALRAGVNQNEHDLRYSTRAQLMAAAAGELVRRWSAAHPPAEVRRYRGRPRDAWLAAARQGSNRSFSTERRVWQELMMASLIDDQLRQRLLPISLNVGALAVRYVKALPGADRVPDDVLVGVGLTLLQMSDLDSTYFAMAARPVPGIEMAMELLMGKLYDEYVGNRRVTAW